MDQSTEPTTTDRPRATLATIRSLSRSRYGHELLLFVALAVLAVFFSARSPFFLSVGNIRNILISVSVLGLLALPVTMLMVAANIDISAPGVAALAGAMLAVVSNGGQGSILFGVLAALVFGAVAGLINAGLIVGLGINSIIGTLGTLYVWRGVTNLVTGGQTLSLSGFDAIGTGRVAGIPIQVGIFLGAALIAALILGNAIFGRHLFAIGSNQEAARLAGVRAKRNLMVIFLANGIVGAFAGLMLTSQLGAASPTVGDGLELLVVTAVILGGASLRGGKGSVEGTILGVLILGVLQNGLTITNVSSFWQEVVQGVVLVAAVSVDRLRTRVGGDYA